MTCSPAYARKVIKEFEEAVRAHAWRGSQHPEDIPLIEKEYERQKRLMMDRLTGVQTLFGRKV